MPAGCRPAVPPCLPRTPSHLPSTQAEGLVFQGSDSVPDLDTVCDPAALIQIPLIQELCGATSSLNVNMLLREMFQLTEASPEYSWLSFRKCMLAKRPCAPSTVCISTAPTTPGSRHSTPLASGLTVKLSSCRRLMVSTQGSEQDQIQALGTSFRRSTGGNTQLRRTEEWRDGGNVAVEVCVSPLAPSLPCSLWPLACTSPPRQATKKEPVLHPTCWTGKGNQQLRSSG